MIFVCWSWSLWKMIIKCKIGELSSWLSRIWCLKVIIEIWKGRRVKLNWRDYSHWRLLRLWRVIWIMLNMIIWRFKRRMRDYNLRMRGWRMNWWQWIRRCRFLIKWVLRRKRGLRVLELNRGSKEIGKEVFWMILKKNRRILLVLREVIWWIMLRNWILVGWIC